MKHFNWENYLQKYPDLKHLKTEACAIQHFNHFGIHEGRNDKLEIRYIELYDRPDRLGANITNYIAQILYAHYHSIGIRLIKDYNYSNSPFVQFLLQHIREHSFPGDSKIEYCNTSDYTSLIGETTQNIECDFVSYFKKYIKSSFNISFDIPFDISKCILVHLRLGDVREAPDYNGSFCTEYYKFLVEHGQSCLYSHPNEGNRQAPLSTFKIKLVLDELLKKYPDYTIKVVTNPNEITDLEYPVVQSEDENYDLYLLSKAPVVVLSRSTFSLSALFFGDHQEVYIPSWGHTACMGLNTKFDHSNFKYFY